MDSDGLVLGVDLEKGILGCKKEYGIGRGALGIVFRPRTGVQCGSTSARGPSSPRPPPPSPPSPFPRLGPSVQNTLWDYDATRMARRHQRKRAREHRPAWVHE